MSRSVAMQDTVEAVVEALGSRAETVAQHPRATLLPAAHAERVAGAGELIARLTPTARPGPPIAGIELHGTLGEGGMGVVRLGTQRSLGREVAVKTLKAGLEDHAPSTARILREAWVTGRLEHPNVVPVYDIAVDRDGRPQIVLKKIVGDEWATLLHDASGVRDKHGAEDLLEWNLQILMQVCNAVHFAHSRGILHRDLKPENVMIGAFGEVYLVDWGIALGLGDAPPWLPSARDATEMAGTPAYMAPEMLGGTPSRLSERTDVYLLGAILCEVVSGKPPHQGCSLLEIVSSVLDSAPSLGEDVPRALTAIVRRAMHPDPRQRYADAEAVRKALAAFSRRRAGLLLAQKAAARVAALEALLEPGSGGTELRGAAYEQFGECRFGLRHALEVWPENEAARETLDRAVTRMVRFELDHDEPEAARALLADLSQIPDSLKAEVDAARQERARRDAELKRVAADQDPNAGRGVRLAVVGALGVMWVAAPLVLAAATQAGWSEMSNGRFVGGFVGYTVLLGALGFWQRDTILRTRINRQVAMTVLAGVLSVLVVALLAYLQGRPDERGPVESLLALSVLGFSLGASIDRRLFASGAVYLAGYVWMSFHDWSSYVVAACNALVLLNVALLWWRPARARDDVN